jgi:hypothetical protein
VTGIPHLFPVFVFIPIALLIASFDVPVARISMHTVSIPMLILIFILVESAPHIPHIPNFHIRPLLAKIERLDLNRTEKRGSRAAGGG